MPTAKYVRRGVVAVAAIANPPESHLTKAVCEALMHVISAVQRDDDVRALLLVGASSKFSTGVNHDDLDAECVGSIRALCDAIESSCKPVVAVMHGSALGAGLEVALAAHYRAAIPGTKLGFPDIKVGIEAALDLLTTGRLIGTQEAFEAGLIDRVCAETSAHAGRAY